MPEKGRLRNLSARLARGHPIEWDREEASASTEEEREAIRQLRIVAALTAFHETARSEEPPDLTQSISVARSVAEEGGRSIAATAEMLPSLPAGTRWAHLEILEPIGRGGFGDVYRARDTRLDRIVALKLLAGEAPAAGDEAVREARLLARVRHPHVVTVYGADRVDGRVGIWMEYLRGETLERLLKQRGALDAREAALIGIDVCRAISAVHAAGIAHRDVKLANIMRAEGGRIVLMDFGLGLEAPRGGGVKRARKLSGTPLFMAPEVLRGAPEDARSEIYSLGVVLFALVTGRLPVEASSVSELLARHERHEARRARDLRPDLPEAFALVLDRALDPDPRRRFQTAGEAEKALLTSLGAAVTSPAVDSRKGAGRRVGPAALAVLVILVAAAMGRFIRLPRPAPESAVRAPFHDVPDLTLVGEDSAGLFGLTVAGAGDVDKDGFDDVMIAAPLLGGAGALTGRVYLYRGSRDGLGAAPSWTFELPEPGLHLGYDIAPFTNLHQGSYPSLVIGAPGNGEPPFERESKVIVFRGSREGPGTAPAQVLRSDTPRTGFGFALSTGDVNHDGGDDLLVGEPWYPGYPRGSGRALLYMSSSDSFAVRPAWTFAGPESSLFGMATALGGDLNNDGYGDAAIGAPTARFGVGGRETGAIYVFLGTSTGLDTVPLIIPGRQPGARFGRCVFFAGDLDADSFQDLFVGSEEASNGERNEGVGEIYFGSPSGPSIYGAVLLQPNVMGANFGSRGGPLGDLDGDGCDDFFVGAVRYQRTQPRAGAAFIFHGSRQRIIQPAWFRVGPRGGTWYGGAGGAAGDVNGDGFPDFLVGGPSWDTDAGENTGMVEVFLNTRTH